MKQSKCIPLLLYLVLLTFLWNPTVACYSKACPKNYRQAYVGREEYKCVATVDKYGKCPLGSVTDKSFGCRYESKGKKIQKQEHGPQMFGQQKKTGAASFKSSRGGGGGGRGGGGGKG